MPPIYHDRIRESAARVRRGVEKVRERAAKHHRVLWWVHSAYALGLGAFVATFAEKGLAHARFVACSLVAAWFLIVVFFRAFGSGRDQLRIDGGPTGLRLRFFAMSYALKNLYQGMLFFLLPFYVKGATYDSVNVGFAALLVVAAILSTLDVVFDRFFLRHHAWASVFHAVALFGSLDLVIPAVAPSIPSESALVLAATLALVAFFTLHLPFRDLRRPWVAIVAAAGVVAGAGNAYVLRRAIPPVPLRVVHAAVGTAVLPDGSLAIEVRRLHVALLPELVAETDVMATAGGVTSLRHVYRRGARRIVRDVTATRLDAPGGAKALARWRLSSSLGATGHDYDGETDEGAWNLDVETGSGQLVGRTRFRAVR